MKLFKALLKNSHPLKDLYNHKINEKIIKEDKFQANVIDQLCDFSDQIALSRKKRYLFQKTNTDAIKGIYLFGGVGSGKTTLMNMFYETLHPEIRKTRAHFHHFMISLHKSLHELKLEKIAEPIRHVSQELRQMNNVTDIADAMLLRQLLENMFQQGIYIVTTSNRHPDDLYKNGIQRDSFIPCIELIKRECRVINLDGGVDYRLNKHNAHNHVTAKTYFSPVTETTSNEVLQLFHKIIGDTKVGEDFLVTFGRNVRIPVAAGHYSLFHFNELCGQPLGAADYISLIQKYSVIFILGIPMLDSIDRNELRRFITFIDAAYDNNIKLLMQAAEKPKNLFGSSEAIPRNSSHDEYFAINRLISRLEEMSKDTAWLVNVYVKSAAANVTVELANNCYFLSNMTNTINDNASAGSTFIYSISLTCSVSGNYDFYVIVDGDINTRHEFFVHFQVERCYEWYLAAKPGMNSVSQTNYIENGKSEVRVWLYSTYLSSDFENNGTAVLPSVASGQLSKAIYANGDAPVLLTRSYSMASVSEPSFKDGYWSAYVTPSEQGIPIALTIGGNSVSVMSCRSYANEFVINIGKYSINSAFINIGSLNVSAATNSSYLNIVTDRCANSVSIGLSDIYPNGVFSFSQDNFKSTTKFYKLNINYTFLYSAAFADSTIAFLTDTGVYVVDKLIRNIVKSRGIPDVNSLNVLRDMDACDLLRLESLPLSKYLFAFDNKPYNSTIYSSQGKIYFSNDGGYSFSGIVLPLGNGNSTRQIYDVAVESSNGNIFIFCRNSFGKDLILSYLNGIFTTKYSFELNFFPFKSLFNSNAKHFQLHSTVDGTPQMFLLSDIVLTSLNGGELFMETKFKITDSDLFSAPRVYNRVFSIVEVSFTGCLPTEIVNFQFDHLGNILVSTLKSDGSISVRIIDAQNSENDSLTCPFSDLTFQDDSAPLTVSYNSNSETEISISSSNANLIKEDIVTTKSRSGIISNYFTNITLRPFSIKNQGVTNIRFSVYPANLACDEYSSSTVIRVGCPSQRRIKVVSNSTVDCPSTT
ncbi:hypothetical protein ROZALSC1DRAFT_29937, partial [Rozella allomycis CSF55]